MKKYFIAVCSMAFMFLLSSCEKPEQPMTPQEQKTELQRISDEMDKMVLEKDMKDVKEVSAYYANTLSSYNTSAITGKCGKVIDLMDNMFRALPAARPGATVKTVETVETKGFDWNFTSGNGEFRADATNGKWEYVGEGNEEGISLLFTDDKGRDCKVLLRTKKEYVGLLKGTRGASMTLYLSGNKIAECSAVCESDGVADLKTLINAAYGPVLAETIVTTSKGEYSVSDILVYDEKLIADCAVYASGVKFGFVDNQVSSFSTIVAELNVMNLFLAHATVKTSLPDLFFGSWNKSYAEKLQDYIDKNVDVDLYFAGHTGSQAKIKFNVDRSGVPFFGKICVTPYVYFESDGSTWEFSEYFESTSLLPNFLKCLEDLLGNVKITC